MNRNHNSRAIQEEPLSLTSVPLSAALVGSKTGVRGGGGGSSPLPEAAGEGLRAVSGGPPSAGLKGNRFASRRANSDEGSSSRRNVEGVNGVALVVAGSSSGMVAGR